MSTNSTINVFNEHTNKFKQIYGHWDGYYEWAGLMLMRYYRNPTDVTRLTKYGLISAYGAPLWHVGITPQILQSDKMYAITNANKYSGQKATGQLLFELDNYSQHFYNEYGVLKSKDEMFEHLKRYDDCYDYCYINDWWYVSKRVSGKPQLIPLTYNMCGLCGNGYAPAHCVLDVVVRNADTGIAFTYDYFTFNLDKIQKRSSLFMPSVRLIGKVARELQESCNRPQQHYSIYRNLLSNAILRWRTLSKTGDNDVCRTIAEAPWLHIPYAIYLAGYSHYDAPIYTILQSQMCILKDNWSPGVQVMLNISDKENTAETYCRINMPEFEDTNLILNTATKLTADDLVTIDGLRWVKVSDRVWTQEEYKAFIKACDAKIKAEHPAIQL